MVFLKNIAKTIVVMTVLCVIWELLEVHLYGTVQHREVDDIMMLLFLPVIYKAISGGH